MVEWQLPKLLMSVRFRSPAFIFIVLCLVSLGGCVSAPVQKAQPSPLPVTARGMYHRVEKGQTLWRISRLYGVEMDDLLDANQLTGTSGLTEGQLLLIPDRKQKQAVTPGAGGLEEEFIWPLKGKIIRRYGDYMESAASKGMDIEPAGRNLVVASRGGTVAFYSDDFLDLGKTVILEHPGGFWTVYAGSSEVFVKAGDVVAQGAAIARAGKGPGGRNYIHFEIRKGHIPQNPIYYLSR